MLKERMSLRLPNDLITAIDRAAAAQSRTRSNYVDLTLTRALSVPVAKLGQIEGEAVGKRPRLLAVRLSAQTAVRLSRAAHASQRSRGAMLACLLAGALADGWSDRVEALAPRPRAKQQDSSADIFA